MVIMLVSAFFTWWYGSGWMKIVSQLKQRNQSVLQEFSVKQLLQTLFAPWKRIITYPGASLVERWRAWNDNLFSRLVGFIIRLFVLLVALVVLLAITLVTVVEFIIWPLIPLAVPACIVWGLLI